MATDNNRIPATHPGYNIINSIIIYTCVVQIDVFKLGSDDICIVIPRCVCVCACVCVRAHACVCAYVYGLISW